MINNIDLNYILFKDIIFYLGKPVKKYKHNYNINILLNFYKLQNIRSSFNRIVFKYIKLKLNK